MVYVNVLQRSFRLILAGFFTLPWFDSLQCHGVLLQFLYKTTLLMCKVKSSQQFLCEHIYVIYIFVRVFIFDLYVFFIVAES